MNRCFTELNSKIIERPIIFSDSMVRAIVNGNKTQTRRVIKGKNSNLVKFFGGNDEDTFGNCNSLSQCWHKGVFKIGCSEYPEEEYAELSSPYGKIGDVLWLRETWKISSFMDGDPIEFQYKADGTICEENIYGADSLNYEQWYENICIQSTHELKKMKWPLKNEEEIYCWPRGKSPLRWRPSIHMPRWASRIDLKVTDIRIERLQNISFADAIQEGVAASDDPNDWRPKWVSLWNSINEVRGYGWNINPWVWVLEFKVLKRS